MGKLSLVIKYKEDITKDYIGMHKKIIEEKGYCWFGKIGKNTAPIAVITGSNFSLL